MSIWLGIDKRQCLFCNGYEDSTKTRSSSKEALRKDIAAASPRRRPGRWPAWNCGIASTPAGQRGTSALPGSQKSRYQSHVRSSRVVFTKPAIRTGGSPATARTFIDIDGGNSSGITIRS